MDVIRWDVVTEAGKVTATFWAPVAPIVFLPDGWVMVAAAIKSGLGVASIERPLWSGT